MNQKNTPFPEAVRITPDSLHHFFGYYDKCPWNASQRLLLTHRVAFRGRVPRPDDEVEIGVIDLTVDHPNFHPVARSRTWNWQQGAMLQWWPAEAESTIVFNDYRDGDFVSVVYDIASGKERVLPRPVAAVSPDGSVAACLSFSRLHDERPGYGYPHKADPFSEEDAPEADGLEVMDMRSGKHGLIFSLDAAAAFERLPSMERGKHRFNHVLFSPNSERIVFLHRWRGMRYGHYTRMLTIGKEGGDPWCVNSHDMTSHFDWQDDRHIVAWAHRREIGNRYFRFTDRSTEVRVLGETHLTSGGDGHCSFSPNREVMLTDTYPTFQSDDQTLLLYKPETDELRKLGCFQSLRIEEAMRCDLHPRWSRDGKKICFDSTHEGTRQVYMMNIEGELSKFSGKSR